MAEQDIVACSGCGKKFRIPDGSPPSGKFACTACGADVAWGGAKTASTGAGKPSKGGGRSRARRAAKEKKESAGGSRGARRAKGRRARDGGDDAEAEAGGGRRGRVPKEKENKTLPLVIALMGIVLLVGGLILAFTGDPPDYESQAAGLEGPTTTAADSTGPGGISNAGNGSSGTDTSGENAATAPDTPAQPIVPLVPDTGDGEDEESGIGGSEAVAEQAKDYRYWFLRDKNELFADVPPIEGTSDEEAAEYRRLAETATDFDAGAQGMKAEGQLAKVGRKAMPFLIQQFEKAWKGSKWSEPGEQFACSKIQQLAREITKADGPPSDLFVRFPPGPGVEASHYERAARMWTAWWRGEGQHIEKFKSYEDEE